MKLATFVTTSVLALVCIGTAQAQPKQFLIISDIHFNPLADPGLAAKLQAAEPSQWEAIFAADLKSPAVKYGDDSPWALLAALVSGIQDLQTRPKVVIVTGDVLTHKFQDKFATATHATDPAAFRRFASKTFSFIALELEKAAGGAPVVYALGNNDEDCGDYSLQPDGPFLHDTRLPLENLAMTNDAGLKSWYALGSYVRSNPLAAHHLIIAVNSNFWSRRYVDSCADKSAADPGEAELKWLGDQLKHAQEHGDKVWLAYHIPPGIDGHSSSKANQVTPMWKPDYGAAFSKLLDEYRNTIELNLAGHTHLDDIRLVKTEHTDTLVLISPAVSPNVGQNPAFRLVTVDGHAHVQDIMTYYMPDIAALKWQLEYSTRPTYGLKKIDAKSYEALYAQIDQSKELSEKWKLFYSVSRLAGLADSKTYLRSLYCATGNATAEAYQTCLTAKPN